MSIQNLQIKSFLMNPKLTNWTDGQDLGRLESWKYQEWKHPKRHSHAVGRVQKLACRSLPIKIVRVGQSSRSTMKPKEE